MMVIRLFWCKFSKAHVHLAAPCNAFSCRRRPQDACNLQEQLTFLPPQVEDFFRPPAMQQALGCSFM